MKAIRLMVIFLWILSFLVIMFYLWQIDVSVGAMNCGGHVYQDGSLVTPLKYYEHSMNGVITWGFINLLSSFYLIFFRRVWREITTKTVPKRQKHKNSPGK